MIEIPDDRVKMALYELHSNRAAIARAAYEVAERGLKVTLARQIAASNLKTATERETAALASEAYAEALKDFRLIAEEYHTARDRRDAAAALLDAWRTLQATNRSMDKRAA